MLLEVFHEKDSEGGVHARVQARSFATSSGGEAVRKVAREIGIPEQSVRNWVKAQAAGKLGGVEGGKPITLEQMELSRLRAENARLKMEMEILKKAAVGSTIQCNTFVTCPTSSTH